MSLRLRCRIFAVAFSGAAGCALTGVAEAQSLQQVGTIGNYTGNASYLELGDDGYVSGGNAVNRSQGFAISGDGSTLVGDSGTASGYAHAFALTNGANGDDLGAFTTFSDATAVSTNGSVKVGFAGVSSGTYHAFVQTGTGALQDIGTLAGPNGYSFASGVSGDGTIVVGATYTQTSIDRAFRWTAATGMQNLGLIPGGTGYSDAYGISRDGTTIVGQSGSPSGDIHAFSYTAATGMVDLGTIGNVSGMSQARAVNANGTVIVGQSITASGDTHAARWAAGTVTDLGTLNGVSGNSGALAIDDNGAIIGGFSAYGGPTNHAFIYTPATGIQDLNVLLTAAGVNMTNVNLVRVNGLSSDGSVIVGSGTFPSSAGSEQAYIARLVSVSTPTPVTTPVPVATPTPVVSPSALTSSTPAVSPSLPATTTLIAGVTTEQSVLASIEKLADSRIAQFITNRVLSSILLGANEQVSCGSCVSGFTSFGSFSAGGHGRYNLTDSLTVLGGASLSEHDDGGASVGISPTVAASLRYDPANLGPSRPFAEVGAVATPTEPVRYQRSYVNGAGLAAGVADTNASDYSVFGRLGWVARLSPIDEFAASLDYSHGWQQVRGYNEALTTANPFEAHVQTGTDEVNIVKAGLQYTRLLTDRIEINLNGGPSYLFGEDSGLKGAIGGFGTFNRPKLPDVAFFDGGARVGFRLAGLSAIDAFVDVAAGPRPIGTSAHGGLAYRYEF